MPTAYHHLTYHDRIQINALLHMLRRLLSFTPSFMAAFS